MEREGKQLVQCYKLDSNWFPNRFRTVRSCLPTLPVRWHRSKLLQLGERAEPMSFPPIWRGKTSLQRKVYLFGKRIAITYTCHANKPHIRVIWLDQTIVNTASARFSLPAQITRISDDTVVVTNVVLLQVLPEPPLYSTGKPSSYLQWLQLLWRKLRCISGNNSVNYQKKKLLFPVFHFAFSVINQDHLEVQPRSQGPRLLDV